MTAKLTIVKDIVVDKYLKASLYNNGIIEVVWDKTIETFEVIHLEKMQQTVGELGTGKKMPLLFNVHEFLHLSKEGGKYATSDEGVKYSQAIAVIVDNLAKRILLNFFLNFNKPKIPTKGFRTKEEAFVWLEKYVSASF